MSEIIEELKNAAVAFERTAEAALRQARELRGKIAEFLSREWIRANGVRAEDVEPSSGPSTPYFGNVYSFGDWLKDHSTKGWAEWNGRIHSRAELANGVFDASAPGFACHLEGWQE